MANIHLSTSGNGGNIRISGNGNQQSVKVGDPTMPKYVGARAVVTRDENGVTIWMSDYKGITEETIAEAIQSIVTNDDGSLTFVLPDEREITTDSLTGPQGEQGPQGIQGPTGVGIASIEKTGTSGLVDTYTITYTDGDTDTFTVTNGENGITDVQVDGSSVVSSGVATIPKAGVSTFGVMEITSAPAPARVTLTGAGSSMDVPMLVDGTVSSGVLPYATSSSKGAIRMYTVSGSPNEYAIRLYYGSGTNDYYETVCIDGNGLIKAMYLPKASTSAFGVVKVGTAGAFIEHGQTIITTADGDLGVPAIDLSTHKLYSQVLPAATSSAYGAIKIEDIGSDAPHAQLKITYSNGTSTATKAIPIMNSTDGTGTVKPYLLPEFLEGDEYSAGTKGIASAPPQLTNEFMLNKGVLCSDNVWRTMVAKITAASSGPNAGKLAVTLQGKNSSGTTTSFSNPTLIPEATTQANGVMSATDKTKLDSITMTNGVIDVSCLPVYSGGVS